MNFEKLLGQQAFKNHKCNPFQSSSQLSCFERLFIFLMFHPGVLPSLMAVSIESFDFSVNIWPQILEKTLHIRALFYHRGSPVKL